MKFTDLPASLQRKLVSGEPWVVEPHERVALNAYLSQHLPRPRILDPFGLPPEHPSFDCSGGVRLPRKWLEPIRRPIYQPGDMLKTAYNAVLGRLKRDLFDELAETLAFERSLPQGKPSEPGSWEVVGELLGPEATARIRG
ncbi:hypothetical protein Bhz59_00061 [Stenotrophomonas phage vB_SmaS_Bhz59]